MKTRISRSSSPRVSAGLSVDVTRLEHENLYGQVSELLEAVQRLETELLRQHRRIALLEAPKQQ